MMLAVIMFAGLLPMNVFADDWTSLGITLDGTDGGSGGDLVSLTLNVKNTVIGSDRPASNRQIFTFTLSGKGNIAGHVKNNFPSLLYDRKDRTDMYSFIHNSVTLTVLKKKGITDIISYV